MNVHEVVVDAFLKPRGVVDLGKVHRVLQQDPRFDVARRESTGVRVLGVGNDVSNDEQRQDRGACRPREYRQRSGAHETASLDPVDPYGNGRVPSAATLDRPGIAGPQNTGLQWAGTLRSCARVDLAYASNGVEQSRKPRTSATAHTAILMAATFVGVGERVAVICQRPQAVLGRYGSDDLFYYTEVARHVAKGQGVSFDGVNPTSGVQPLWALLLTPWARLFDGNPSLALAVDLSLVTAFTVASGWLMPHVVRALLCREPVCSSTDDASRRALGILAGCVWLVHPRVLAVTFEGTEGALAALCWQLSILAWLAEDRPLATVRLGAALGMGTLARIDHLALAAALVLWPRRRNRSLSRAATLIVPVAALWGSWLLFCVRTTGSIVPDSGESKRVGHERLSRLMLDASTEPPGGWAQARRQGGMLASVLRNAFSHLFRAGTHVSRVTAVASCAILMCLLVRFVGSGRVGASQSPRWRAAAAQTAPLTLGLCRSSWPVWLAGTSALLSYVVVLHHVRGWYTMPLQLMVTLLASALCLDAVGALERGWSSGFGIPTRGFRRPKHLAALTCVVWLGAAWDEDISFRARSSWLVAYVATARRIVAITPPGARVGAFNSGIIGAFASEGGRRVTNLDGVVNHSALLANETGTVTAYVANEGIEFIADFLPTIQAAERIVAPGLQRHLELVEAVPVDDHPGESLGIWRFRTH